MNYSLITGAHGFIGKHLAKHLESSGETTCGIGHGMWPDSEAEQWGINDWVNSDITIASLKYLQKKHGTPQTIYHLAGGSAVGPSIANPKEDFARTVATTLELLEWARLESQTTKLVVISSAAVYGAGHLGPIKENAISTPFSPYGFHKRMMEELCESYSTTYGLRIAVVRLFSVFGPELKKQLLWDVGCRLSKKPEELVLGGTGEELRDWTDVRDVVKAIRTLASKFDTNFLISNAGTGSGTSVKEIAQLLIKNWCSGSETEPELSFTGHSRPGDPFSLVSETSKLNESSFTWDTPLETGIADYVNWQKKLFREQ